MGWMPITLSSVNLTLKMTSAQVVETSVNVTLNSPSQDYTHPDDRTPLSYDMTPGFKPFTMLKKYFKMGGNANMPSVNQLFRLEMKILVLLSGWKSLEKRDGFHKIAILQNLLILRNEFKSATVKICGCYVEKRSVRWNCFFYGAFAHNHYHWSFKVLV